jgi:hypothetical protein
MLLAWAWKGVTAELSTNVPKRLWAFLGSGALLLLVGACFCHPVRPTIAVEKVTTLLGMHLTRNIAVVHSWLTDTARKDWLTAALAIIAVTVYLTAAYVSETEKSSRLEIEDSIVPKDVGDAKRELGRYTAGRQFRCASSWTICLCVLVEINGIPTVLWVGRDRVAIALAVVFALLWCLALPIAVFAWRDYIRTCNRTRPLGSSPRSFSYRDIARSAAVVVVFSAITTLGIGLLLPFGLHQMLTNPRWAPRGKEPARRSVPLSVEEQRKAFASGATARRLMSVDQPLRDASRHPRHRFQVGVPDDSVTTDEAAGTGSVDHLSVADQVDVNDVAPAGDGEGDEGALGLMDGSADGDVSL